MNNRHPVSVIVLVSISLCSCMNATPPRPAGIPLGASVYCWSNDFLRNSDGSIWVVNGTWTKDDNIVFQDHKYTPDEFRQLLVTEAIPTNTAIRLVFQPGAIEDETISCNSAAAREWPNFVESGYSNFGFLSVPRKYWKYWMKNNWRPSKPMEPTE